MYDLSNRSLSKAFHNVVTFPLSTSNVRFAAFASIYWLSNDRLSLFQTPLLKILNFRKDISNIIQACENIDDLIDSVPPETISTCDFSIGKDGINNFLHNNAFVPKAYLKSLYVLIKAGLIEDSVAIGYSNQFCNYVQKNAALKILVNNTNASYTRLLMAQENIKMGAIFGCFFFGFLRPIQKGHVTDPAQITHEQVKIFYPEAYYINQAGQILDDLFDLAQDAHAEKVTKMPTTNIILAHTFTNACANNDIAAFRDMGQKAFYVKPKDLPLSIKEGLQQVYELFLESASHVKSSPSRFILEGFWHSTIKRGFQTPIHPKTIYENQRAELKHASVQ